MDEVSEIDIVDPINPLFIPVPFIGDPSKLGIDTDDEELEETDTPAPKRSISLRLARAINFRYFVKK